MVQADAPGTHDGTSMLVVLQEEALGLQLIHCILLQEAY